MLLPSLNPKGSKYPNGADSPARPSAVIDSLTADRRTIGAGRKAAAEAAREAMKITWSIFGEQRDLISGDSSKESNAMQANFIEVTNHFVNIATLQFSAQHFY